MDKRLLELSVDIVQALASMSKLTGEEVEQTLIKTYNALHRMKRAEDEGRTVGLGNDTPEERERRRLAVELHDRVGQLLAVS